MTTISKTLDDGHEQSLLNGVSLINVLAFFINPSVFINIKTTINVVNTVISKKIPVKVQKENI